MYQRKKSKGKNSENKSTILKIRQSSVIKRANLEIRQFSVIKTTLLKIKQLSVKFGQSSLK